MAFTDTFIAIKYHLHKQIYSIPFIFFNSIEIKIHVTVHELRHEYLSWFF